MKIGLLKKAITFTLMTTMLWSCGDSKKKNTVNSTGTGVQLPSSPVGTGQTQVSAQSYSSILNQVQCRTGNYNGFQIGSRLSTVYTFHLANSNNASQTTLSGSFAPGGVGGSDVSRVYLGVGYYGDVMLVQKVTQGSQVIGYNVIISMCSMSSTSGAPYISDSRPLSNFQGSITIDDEVSCGHGMIDRANTVMVSQTDPNYSYLPAFQVNTSFTKVGCVNF
ncbi:hypothetical protein A9Q84_04320 [Halobacteriovorax marinus]|uniref:Uncharacterized protein n=1 Tax=Halobacteriovorax marinus TaxID=97084 RepID=A0A1Y5FAX3_9BACT|nr:hypothetical protein A9Q84_04320 [Halobacteriovorax marinus]